MADTINGLFEMIGGAFVALNVIRLYRDKLVRGVSPIAIGFFTVWGYWNLYYYPSLSQLWSSLGAGSVALVNTTYLFMMIYYIRREKRCEA